MGISPVAAIPQVLAQTGLTKEDVDVFEVCTRLLAVVKRLTPCEDKRSFRLAICVLRRGVKYFNGQG